MISLATEKLFGHGQEDDQTTLRLKLLRLLTNPSGWHGLLGQTCTLLRCDAGMWTKLSDKWAECSSQNSRSIFDAWTRSESPQLRLRSSRTSEEARGIKEQCAVSNARIHCVNALTMLADSLTKPGYPARALMESFQVEKRWKCAFDPTFESGNRRKARGAPLFNDEDLDDINPLTDPVAFDTLMQDESLSEDVCEITRMTSLCLFLNGQRSRKRFEHARHENTTSCSETRF